jgi:hypothetical protein
MRALLLAVLLVATPLATPLVADEGIDITEPGRVGLLRAIQRQLDGLADAIAGCLVEGREHAECMCRSWPRMAEFANSIEGLDALYPDLRELDVVRFRDVDGFWVSQSLVGLRRQAGYEPECLDDSGL